MFFFLTIQYCETRRCLGFLHWAYEAEKIQQFLFREMACCTDNYEKLRFKFEKIHRRHVHHDVCCCEEGKVTFPYVCFLQLS